MLRIAVYAPFGRPGGLRSGPHLPVAIAIFLSVATFSA